MIPTRILSLRCYIVAGFLCQSLWAASPEALCTGPYCGVVAAHGALQIHGIDVPFAELLEPEYIDEQGSNMQQLLRLLSEKGARGFPLQGIGSSYLRGCNVPVILHVRRPGYDMPYAHWVLFVGSNDGRARVMDPPHDLQRMRFAELVATSDGFGIVVTREPALTRPSRIPAMLNSLAAFAVTFALYFASRTVLDPFARQCWLAIVLATAGAGTLWHFFHADGLLANDVAVGQIMCQHFRPELKSIDDSALAALLKRSDILLIDARFPSDYELGHLPGAINLPVTSTVAERSAILHPYRRDGTVVVYCQSEQCSWAENVAGDLMFRGFSDIHVYPGGWNQYAEQFIRPAESAKTGAADLENDK